MRTDERTSRHLMLAIIATVFSSVLNFVTTSLDWELWVIPLIVVGCVSIWILHILSIDGACPGKFPAWCRHFRRVVSNITQYLSIFIFYHEKTGL